MILYTCAKSRGLRVTWVVEEIGLDIDLRVLPFPPRAKAKEFFDINPLGTVPALVDGNIVMTESSAITEYLAAKYSPGDLAVSLHEPDFGVYLDYLHHADATLTFPQTIYFRFVVFEKERGLEAAGEAYVDWFASRLKKLDQRLEGREFLCSDRFTAADIAIGYALYLSRLNGLDKHLTPRIVAYLDRLVARPAFVAAMERELATLKSTKVA